ncbi:TAXI family TRAP transporter solute-binding subunit [Aminiphilus sp.]|uniref:TAXI family TRAP transporter solute-binding subunit n=1 Tax=Aminiphilus sp. TaxID=1872488 RepID=UPI0026379AA5|nr:TAXI family TRAP transporter solute-binding subunit [Aminiphilus sp.]
MIGRRTGMRRNLCCAVALMVALLSASMACADAPLRFATAASGGIWNAMGGVMGEEFGKNGIPVSVTTGGSIPNLVNMSQGKVDVAFTVLYPGMSVDPEGPFKGQSLENVRLLAHLYPQYVYFVIRKDFADKNGITTVGDLFNKKLPFRYATLARGNITEFLVRQIMDAYGVTEAEFTAWGGQVNYSSYADGVNQMADGHVDAYVVSSGLPLSAIMDLESRIDVVLLPFENEILKKMWDRFGTQAYLIPKGSYKSATTDIPTVGAMTSMVVRVDLPEETVYTMTKLLFEHRDEMAAAVKALEALELKTASEKIEFPFHPGAERYYKEQGF